MAERKAYAESFSMAVAALGIDGQPMPEVRQTPCYDAEELGPSLFRTCVENVALAELTLPGLFVGRSELRQVRLVDCDLRLSRLCWNDFTACEFDRSNLEGSDFRDSNYLRCSFRGARLCGADLRRTFFEQCDFSLADLTGARAAESFRTSHRLSKAQLAQIEWTDDEGPEAPGG